MDACDCGGCDGCADCGECCGPDCCGPSDCNGGDCCAGLLTGLCLGECCASNKNEKNDRCCILMWILMAVLIVGSLISYLQKNKETDKPSKIKKIEQQVEKSVESDTPTKWQKTKEVIHELTK